MCAIGGSSPTMSLGDHGMADDNAVGGRRVETYAFDNAVLNRILAYGVGRCRFLRGIHYRVRMLGGKQY